jgi:hypothetical protein
MIGDLCPGFISLTPLLPGAPWARNFANRHDQYNPATSGLSSYCATIISTTHLWRDR